MNDFNIQSRDTTTRRFYPRRNRKKNITDPILAPAIDSLPLTTTILTTTNSTLLINSSSIPINDLFASVSYFTQNKYIFIVGLFLLIFLCIISIIFIITIWRCKRKNNGKTRRQMKLDQKRLQETRDFLDEHNDHRDENATLLDTYYSKDASAKDSATNGMIHNDNISNTFSIDPMLEKKIIENNPPNSLTVSPTADDMSVDTLRGSLISSPSQQISFNQSHSFLSNVTTTDSMNHPEERVVEAEKDDDLHDLDLKPVTPRYAKIANSSGSSSAHRASTSSIEQTIRKQELNREKEERKFIHGSKPNLYEDSLRKKEEQEKAARKEHTNSQVSLVSRTSEDSCY